MFRLRAQFAREGGWPPGRLLTMASDRRDEAATLCHKSADLPAFQPRDSAGNAISSSRRSRDRQSQQLRLRREGHRIGGPSDRSRSAGRRRRRCLDGPLGRGHPPLPRAPRRLAVSLREARDQPWPGRRAAPRHDRARHAVRLLPQFGRPLVRRLRRPAPRRAHERRLSRRADLLRFPHHRRRRPDPGGDRVVVRFGQAAGQGCRGRSRRR